MNAHFLVFIKEILSFCNICRLWKFYKLYLSSREESTSSCLTVQHSNLQHPLSSDQHHKSSPCCVFNYRLLIGFICNEIKMQNSHCCCWCKANEPNGTSQNQFIKYLNAIQCRQVSVNLSSRGPTRARMLLLPLTWVSLIQSRQIVWNHHTRKTTDEFFLWVPSIFPIMKLAVWFNYHVERL